MLSDCRARVQSSMASVVPVSLQARSGLKEQRLDPVHVHVVIAMERAA